MKDYISLSLRLQISINALKLYCPAVSKTAKTILTRLHLFPWTRKPFKEIVHVSLIRMSLWYVLCFLRLGELLGVSSDELQGQLALRAAQTGQVETAIKKCRFANASLFKLAEDLIIYPH